MGVQVSLYGSLRNYVTQDLLVDNKVVIPYRHGLTVSKICQDLQLDQKYVAFVLVNKNRSKLDAPLMEGDQVDIFPRTIGG